MMAIEVHLKGIMAGRAFRPVVSGAGQTFGELLADLERQYPGIAYDVYTKAFERIRDNIYVYVDDLRVQSMDHPLTDGCVVTIGRHISGG